MDTDFRMFSAQHHGSLPGIDLAYILDGAAYHTNQDTVARIRKGTVQVRAAQQASSWGFGRFAWEMRVGLRSYLLMGFDSIDMNTI